MQTNPPIKVQKTGYSIIVPIYNEEGNIQKLYENIISVMDTLELGGEIIIIDDGSRDASFSILKHLASQEHRLKVLRFRRNFGQTAAMSAGFNEAQGEIILPMDGDLQNDPKDIPRLMEKIHEGFDVVSGWRKDRKDKSLSRKLPSLLANKLIGRISGVTIHDYGCTLKAYRKEALDGIRLYGEMHRFIPAYVAWNGGRVTEMIVAHHERISGVSKYGISRTAKVILDLLVLKFLTAYMNRPIHFFGVAGLASIFLGGLSGVTALVLKFGYAVSFIETPLPLLTVFLVFLGVQFILLGLLAEMLMRIYYESQDKMTYTIAEKINF